VIYSATKTTIGSEFDWKKLLRELVLETECYFFVLCGVLR